MRKAVAELVTLFPLEPFYEAFKKFIGGSQWMVDREEMANALFRSTAQLDFATIEAHLSGSRLVALAPRLGAHLTDEDAQRWHQLEAGNVLSILTDRPELDYRQLHDPRYSRSERGQFLARAYAHFCGEVAAKRYRSSSVNEKPLLPVSQYPVLAGLLEDVVRSRIPTQSSSSARDVARLVLASDSVEAQVALFEIISAPTPQGQNHPFPGPSEFEVRRELVGDVWKAYVSATAENHRKVLRNGLQDILMAYTSGDLAAALVQQDPKAGAEGHGLSNRAPLSQARRIVRDLINAFLNFGDHELTATAVRITRSAQSLVKPVTRTAGARTLS